jgi:TPR repeat protein
MRVTNGIPLGRSLFSPIGTVNHVQALKAEAGEAGAQSNLGTLLDCGGAGFPPNRAAALRWYTAAAEQGDAKAQFNLGLARMEGGDNEAAATWFSAAAGQGHADAAFNLGAAYVWYPPNPPSNQAPDA